MDKWGLDPLYWSFVKVFIVQVHQLTLFEGTADTHMLYGRPISRVELVGVVVSVKQHARFVKYLIDDGTGVIACMVWKNHADSVSRGESEPSLFQLGATVCVHGKLNIQTRRYLASGTTRALAGARATLLESTSNMVKRSVVDATSPQKRARISAQAEAKAEPRYCLEREREVIVQRMRSLHALHDRGFEENHWLSVMALTRSVYKHKAHGPLHTAPIAVAAAPGACDDIPADADGGNTVPVGLTASSTEMSVALPTVTHVRAANDDNAVLQNGLVGPCCRCAARTCRCCQRCRQVQWDGSCYHRISLASDPDASFRDALVRQLVSMEANVDSGGMLCFLFSEIRQVPALVRKANEVVVMRQQQRERASSISTDHATPAVASLYGVPTVEAQVDQLFVASCAALRSANVLCLRCVERDEYALCSWPRVAEPALMQLFDQQTRCDPNGACSKCDAPVQGTATAVAGDQQMADNGSLKRHTEPWTEDQIARKIKSLPHLSHMQRADVHTLLQRLLQNSKVYEADSSGPTAYLRVPT